jgi:hypothetical protein
MTEEQFHRSVAAYLTAVLKPPTFFSTFPSGGGGRVRGGKLKAMGLKAGMPDIFIWYVSEYGPRTLALELKSKTGKLPKEQKEVHRALENIWVEVEVVRTLEEVQSALVAWNVPMKRVTL